MHLPPPIAALLTVGFIVFLFRRDSKEKHNVTGGLWLPLVWMLIICSRQPSEWLNTFGFNSGAVTLEEGSPFDACIYFSLILAGAYVLSKRHVQLSEIIRNNQWLTIFFVYCFLAIFWSDFPFVAFKRWIKVLGHPIMALIVLTEPNPAKAVTKLLKRCAFVILPVSILFIKYYPEYGRAFDVWTGAALNTGITLNKNALGGDCLILGLFFFWYLLLGIYANAIQLLGKDPTLTDRTLLWHDLLQVEINPIFGAGFESFWLGDRFREFAASRWWAPNQAHNGYLETYLNLGLVGLFLLIAVLIATFWKGRGELFRNFEFGRFRLGFLLAVIAYNWTEAAFKNISPIWFVFYLIALDYPQREFAADEESVAIDRVEAEGELISAADLNPVGTAFTTSNRFEC